MPEGQRVTREKREELPDLCAQGEFKSTAPPTLVASQAKAPAAQIPPPLAKSTHPAQSESPDHPAPPFDNSIAPRTTNPPPSATPHPPLPHPTPHPARRPRHPPRPQSLDKPEALLLQPEADDVFVRVQFPLGEIAMLNQPLDAASVRVSPGRGADGRGVCSVSLLFGLGDGGFSVKSAVHEQVCDGFDDGADGFERRDELLFVVGRVAHHFAYDDAAFFVGEVVLAPTLRFSAGRFGGSSAGLFPVRVCFSSRAFCLA